MDITKKLEVRSVEWFFGYGGNHIGLKRAIPGLRPIAVCEREAFVVANMVAKMEAGLMDAVPIWTDCKTFPIEPFKDRTDLFIASYPCQGFSTAGKRLGVKDERHLWPYCRRFVQGARPGYVFLENVEGHISLGLSTVLADLEEEGYTTAWGIFSASEVGAPHQRKRVFILAYDKTAEPLWAGGSRAGGTGLADGGRSNEPALRNGIGRSHGESEIKSAEAGVDAQRNSAAGGGEDVAHHHHHHQGLQGMWERGEQAGREVKDGHVGSGCEIWPSRPGQPQYGWEPPRVVNAEKRGERGEQGCDMEAGGKTDVEWETDNHFTYRSGQDCRNASDIQIKSTMGRDFNGPADGVDFAGRSGLDDTELAEIREWMVKDTNRTDELRMCGNGVVPQTAERAFKTLYAELTNE